MVGRRDFLKFLGLAGAVALTPAMVEALAEEKGLGTVPGEILDKIPRPLVVTVPNKIISISSPLTNEEIEAAYQSVMADESNMDYWISMARKAEPVRLVLNNGSFYLEEGDGRIRLFGKPNAGQWLMGVK